MPRHSTWYTHLSNAALSVLAVSAIFVVILLASVFQPRVLALASFASVPPVLEGVTTLPAPNTSAADQEKRIAAAIADMEKKAAGQQTLIGSLATLTGLYVVILSAAAYFRLQQTKDETAAADTRIRALEDRAGKDLDAFLKKISSDSEEALRKIKLDIPAMHGIGRRLEELRIELDQRLPVDGDWSYAYELLSDSQRQQAYIDEMVVNSLDVFSIPENARDRRTVSRLYCSLGQFYFGRTSHLRTLAAQSTPPQAGQMKAEAGIQLLRSRLYFLKAHAVDRKDPVSLRELGNSHIYEAAWRKEDFPALPLDTVLLSTAAVYCEQSLSADPIEPGASMGRAWLYVRETPPRHTDAIAVLTRIVDAGGKDLLPHPMIRKYMSWVLFNRAAYRARVLDDEVAKAQKGLDVNGEVARDLQEGLAATKDLDAADRFRTLLKHETDFNGLRGRDAVFADAVAKLL